MIEFDIRNGDCRDVLKSLADASVDSIVTDPPYELGFMGKAWDATGVAYDPAVWVECLRVLKPGGHLLAFGGSRTYHRMACAIEDAGFEIRDQIMWVYGSGFPKSLDVSKAIDKSTGENRQRQLKFTEWMRSTGITAQQINDATGTNMANHYLAAKSQPAIATADLFDLLRPYLPEVPEEIERLVAERTGIEWTAYQNREIIGSKVSGIANKDESARHTIGASKAIEVDITAPATLEAEQWQGWGTALKPAHEPIVVARKPLTGTVAANVLQHGTGALNIDGCRVGTDGGTSGAGAGPQGNVYGDGLNGTYGTPVPGLGRWPANFIHDGSDEATDLIGEAARFFYCAKASKTDRNGGLDGFEIKQTLGGGGLTNVGDKYGSIKAPAQNHHPTVKPTDLMRYLVRLVTPPNGIVLDPFTGSGSTGKAAVIEGFSFIGIEQDPDYAAIAQARIKYALNTREETLFND